MLGTVLLLQASLRQAAELTVKVENIADDQGQIMVGVFNSAATFLRQIAAGFAVPAASRGASGAVTVTVPGPAQGVYAVSANGIVYITDHFGITAIDLRYD